MDCLTAVPNTHLIGKKGVGSLDQRLYLILGCAIP